MGQWWKGWILHHSRSPHQAVLDGPGGIWDLDQHEESPLCIAGKGLVGFGFWASLGLLLVHRCTVLVTQQQSGSPVLSLSASHPSVKAGDLC